MCRITHEQASEPVGGLDSSPGHYPTLQDQLRCVSRLDGETGKLDRKWLIDMLSWVLLPLRHSLSLGSIAIEALHEFEILWNDD